MSTEAEVYIAKMANSSIIHEFYNQCGYEIAYQFQVKARTPRTVTSLEDVVDGMMSSDAWVQLIVCHGDPDRGLLIPLTRDSRFNSTGVVMSDLAVLAEASDLDSNSSFYEGRLKFVQDTMGIRRDPLMRFIRKLVQLKQTKYFKNIVEIRGCNLAANGKESLQYYRRALGTHMLSAPKCRQLYLPINPENPAKLTWPARSYLGKQKTTMQDLSMSNPPAGKRRRRTFGNIGSTMPPPIVIDVEDIDGHTKVKAHPFMDNPKDTQQVARSLILNWTQAPAGPKSDKFVLPVMWDNNESTYHVPLEWNYAGKLATVTY
jgi:hypothetical protein